MSADTTKGTHVDMIARILVGSDWDEEIPYTDIGSRQYVEDVSGRISTAMAVAYYRQAARSLRALARIRTAIGHSQTARQQQATGYLQAATALERAADDMEDTDA